MRYQGMMRAAARASVAGTTAVALHIALLSVYLRSERPPERARRDDERIRVTLVSRPAPVPSLTAEPLVDSRLVKRPVSVAPEAPTSSPPKREARSSGVAAPVTPPSAGTAAAAREDLAPRRLPEASMGALARALEPSEVASGEAKRALEAAAGRARLALDERQDLEKHIVIVDQG